MSLPRASCLTVLAGLALPAAAAPDTTASLLPGAGGLVQMLGGLMVVLGLIAAAAWLLRRLGAVRGLDGAAMRVVGGLALGSRERLVLVEVAGVRMLLGVGAAGVQALHVFDGPAEDFPASLARVASGESPP